MKQHDILQADLLDIIFERRNKDYGAYVLRKKYPDRLLTALLAGLLLTGLLLFLLLNNHSSKAVRPVAKKEVVILKEYVFNPVKPEPPAPLKPEPVKKTVAKSPALPARKMVNRFEIKEDAAVKTTVSSNASIADTRAGEDDEPGAADNEITGEPVAGTAGDEVKSGPQPEPVSVFTAVESAPEFPGGPLALQRFLASNLRTPDDMEPGERKLVLLKFIVDATGRAGQFEIQQSGGKALDEELLRVAGKMPKWKPGFQNGIHVAVRYMIPVTFVGPE